MSYSARIPIPQGWEAEAWLDHLAEDFDLDLRNCRELDPPEDEENVRAVFLRVGLREFSYLREMGLGTNYFDDSMTEPGFSIPE
jgi:hypothetical protein